MGLLAVVLIHMWSFFLLLSLADLFRYVHRRCWHTYTYGVQTLLSDFHVSARRQSWLKRTMPMPTSQTDLLEFLIHDCMDMKSGELKFINVQNDWIRTHVRQTRHSLVLSEKVANHCCTRWKKKISLSFHAVNWFDFKANSSTRWVFSSCAPPFNQLYMKFIADDDEKKYLGPRFCSRMRNCFRLLFSSTRTKQ